MKSAEYIKRIVENAKIKINPEVKQSALKQLINELEENTNINPVKFKPDIGRIIMNSKIMKLAAAAIIIFVVLIGINQFGGDNTAFADVIGYFQKHSYTFDLKLGGQDSIMRTMHAAVWELGRMRVDYSGIGIGDISSITDFNTNQTIVLFHQDKTAALKNEPVLNKNSGAEEIISFCTRPIAELWNVLNGEEKYLGEKEINNHHVSGFRISKQDQNFKYNIEIWADYKNGFPFIVETTAKPFNESYMTIIWTMENFNLDAELNEELFSLELLPGYTWAYQENTENMEVQTEPTIEARKIIRMLELASEDKIDDAIEVLLQIDWTKPIQFGKEPYIFSISEKGYISLKAEEQNRVLEDIHNSLTKLREITFAIIESGQKAVSDKQNEKAEKYFNAGLKLGKLLEQNPNSMLIVQLVGIAIEKKALNEMIPFYTLTNNDVKLQDAKEQLSAVETIAENIKKQSKELSD